MDDLFGSDSESGEGSPAATPDVSPARSGHSSHAEEDDAVVDEDEAAPSGRKRSTSDSDRKSSASGDEEVQDSAVSPTRSESDRSKDDAQGDGDRSDGNASESGGGSSEASDDDGAVASPDASNADNADERPNAIDERSSDEKDSTGDAERADAGAENLFGDADDISDVDGAQQSSDDEKEASQSVPPEVAAAAEQPEEEEEEEIPETKIDVEIPRVSADLGEKLHFVKLPNFLSVDTRPFDPATYEDEIDEEDVLDEEGHARMKLKVENTIRWRFAKNENGEDILDENGERVRRSNARVVRWSDGSMSLHLGEEIFDVHVMPMQDHNHLFVRQGTGLHGQSLFSTKLTFRPYSTDSFTHRKMTMSLADRSTKLQKIKVLPATGGDPEAEKAKKLREAEESLRAAVRRENQQRRVRERAHMHPVSARFLEGGYDEDDDGEEGNGGVSLAAIKKKYKDKARARQRSSDDEDADDSDAEDMRKKRLQKAKKLDLSDDENDNASDGGAGEESSAAEDDSEDDVGPTKKKLRTADSDDE